MPIDPAPPVPGPAAVPSCSADLSQAGAVPLLRSPLGYQLMFERCPLPMWLYDMRTLRFLEVNAAMVERYGHSEAEFKTMTLHDLRPPMLRDELLEVLARLNADGGSSTFSMLTQHVMRDGRLVDVQVSGQALGDDFPGVRIIVAQDASERLATQRERDRSQALLQSSEASLSKLAMRLTTTLESITDAFFTVDRAWNFTYVNRRAEELLQLDRSQLLGRNGWGLFPPTLGTLVPTEFKRAVRERKAVHFAEFFAPLERWIEVHAYPSDEGLAVYFRDITDLREAEAAQQAKRSAEATSRLKHEFLSRLSHEMRTPLNAMLGFAQLLMLQFTRGQRADDRLQLGYAQHILQAGQHLLSLVNDVLEVQQLDGGRLAFDLAPVDLADCVRAVQQLLTPLAATQAVQMSIDITTGHCVLADPVRLRQVLLNLGANAVKYNRRGGSVRWCVEPRGDAAFAVLVIDDGPGISAPEQAVLFQPFQRLGKEASSIEGAGLGLVVSRALVEQMHGRLTLESAPGQGTCVAVELPRAEAESGADVAQPAASGPAAVSQLDASLVDAMNAPVKQPLRRPCRVLYVEDNNVNAMLFEAAIGSRAGIELRIAVDGQQCMRMVEDWTPDVLALDAHLPDTDGYALLAALRRVPGLADTPAFMCSAAALPEDIERARVAGFHGYWSKPVDIPRIVADIEAVTNPGVPPLGSR